MDTILYISLVDYMNLLLALISIEIDLDML